MDLIPALHNWLDTLNAEDSEEQVEICFEQILRFMALAAHLKDDIKLAQPSTQAINEVPQILPLSIQQFLSSATSIPSSHVEGLWDCVSTVVWNNMAGVMDVRSQVSQFADHGLPVGISRFNCLGI